MMGPVRSGIAVFDTNCIKYLEDPSQRKKVQANLRVADLELWITAVNLLEICKHQNKTARNRLLNTLSNLVGSRPILPWPHQVLAQVGDAISKGEERFQIGDWQLTEILRARNAISSDEVKRVEEFLEDREKNFNAVHEEARAKLRPKLKELGALGQWSDIQEFLESTWLSPDHLDDYLSALWDRFDLPAPAPIERLREVDTWQLFLEGWGAAAYERAVVPEQRKRVEEADLLQLVYLGGTHRRAIITDDSRFYDCANEVLRGRHPLARAVKIESLLD